MQSLYSSEQGVNCVVEYVPGLKYKTAILLATGGTVGFYWCVYSFINSMRNQFSRTKDGFIYTQILRMVLARKAN